jgi:hypothetical protein
MELPQPVNIADFYLRALIDEMQGLRAEVASLTDEVQGLRADLVQAVAIQSEVERPPEADSTSAEETPAAEEPTAGDEQKTEPSRSRKAKDTDGKS